MTGPRRPDPLRWIGYVYGARLPDRYRDWVRRDLAGPHWVPRHLVRVFTQELPVVVAVIVLLWLFTPVNSWAIGCVVVLGLIVSGWFALGMAREFTMSRLRRHGFPPEVAPPRSSWVLSD